MVVIFAVQSLKTSPIPFEISRNAHDWPTANKDYANTRAALGSAITSANVASLGVEWEFPLVGVSEWGSAATNPLIVNNIVYLQDLKSNVYAVNVVTGKQLWTATYNEDTIGPNGVALGYGRIYATKGHHDVVALDMAGKELWKTTVSTDPNVGIDIQPIVYNQRVYVSTVPGVSNTNFYKGGSVGVIYALDAATGKIVWSFDTVDSADIWGNKEVNSGGGAWYPPAVNTEKKLMYWGIGNPAPWPGTKEFPNGSSRPGDNLYTNSLVTLDANAGGMQWYNQVLPHDLFDFDFQISPILVSAMIEGAQKDLVIGAGKMGQVVAFNEADGKTVWSTDVGIHLNDTLLALPRGKVTTVAPGPLGGVETPMAYANGKVFVPIVNLPVGYIESELVSSTFNMGKGTGELVALDVATGKQLWSQKFDSINVGGATVVNDMVFTSTFDGKIYAFAANTGKKLWEFQAPGGINGWPAVSGNRIVFPVGVGQNPVLLSISLGGKLGTTGTQPPKDNVPGKEFQL